ncbi:MAG: aromatic-ring-hydroxylating dioxygenase subunit beta [Pigmentiphaga sp.]|uniref:aromatic-ring-hydroxylating dioxygenase subunit beta n=1 Tax=Pigmentiphaga sp. TaxID=1977564 RepID=UPI0029A3DD8D|nr:aromatic-ring-hydroxylating dioxygenase subunit beta [Pigmentiphaga sp.]MDX3906503.1 aromatic-ring-hydroxylating dioxygenase subunit beta [Pigmentiphaga sp.]
MTGDVRTFEAVEAAAAAMTRADAEDFLYREARLADEHRFDEWLALWDVENVRYWIPAGADDIDPARSISIAYDDRPRLEDRVFRLKSKSAHAQQPRSRLRRVISNVEVAGGEGSVRVDANFMLTEVRRGHQDVFGGRCLYELRHRSGQWVIGSKKVLLVNNDEFIDNLTFLL